MGIVLLMYSLCLEVTGIEGGEGILGVLVAGIYIQSSCAVWCDRVGVKNTCAELVNA